MQDMDYKLWLFSNLLIKITVVILAICLSWIEFS